MHKLYIYMYSKIRFISYRKAMVEIRHCKSWIGEFLGCFFDSTLECLHVPTISFYVCVIVWCRYGTIKGRGSFLRVPILHSNKQTFSNHHEPNLKNDNHHTCKLLYMCSCLFYSELTFSTLVNQNGFHQFEIEQQFSNENLLQPKINTILF